MPKGPALDGSMADPLWQKAPRWPLGKITSEGRWKYAAWARVLFDPTHVYVGVYCEEPDTEHLKQDALKRDGPVWQDDDVEIFLRADPERPYCQFAINPRGTLYDARGKDHAWNGSVKVKTALAKNRCWTVTFCIPMKALGAYVGEEETWTLNIYRSRPARGGNPAMEYAWAVMNSNDFHSPMEFGVVRGVRVPRREDGVTRVRAKPAPRPARFETGQPSGGVVRYRRSLFDKDFGGWTAANGATLTLTKAAVSGKALRVACTGRWAGIQTTLHVGGNKGLKLAFLMRGEGQATAALNVFDEASHDNTTAYGHRRLYEDGSWTPVLYHLWRFRYNSKPTGFVGPRTAYTAIRFFGPSSVKEGTWYALDNLVLYRGDDRQPPGPVMGLKAEAAGDGIRLNWEPAADNVAPMLYVIARAKADGKFVKIAESRTTRFRDETAGHGPCRYRVFAVDFEENLGPWSKTVSVEGKADPRTVHQTREERDRAYYAAHVRELHARGAGKVRRGHAALFGDSLTCATSYQHGCRAAFRTLSVGWYGQGGMKTGWGKAHAKDVIAQENPAFACVLFGTNNGKSEKAIAAAMADLEALIRTFEAHGTVVIMGTIPPRGFKDPDSKGEAAYNAALKALAKRLQVPVAHIFEDFQDKGFEKRRSLLAGDGVHWQGQGFPMSTQAWAKAMDQVRFVLRDQP